MSNDKVIKVFLDYNEEDIKKSIKPYWNRQSRGKPLADYHPQEHFLWYRIEVGGALGGYFCAHDYTEGVVATHICIIDWYRPIKEDIIIEWKKSLKETLREDINYIIGVIPKSIPESIVLAVENGWELVEVYKDEGEKMFVMGISKDDFLEEIQ